jgi:hypothetical protein
MALLAVDLKGATMKFDDPPSFRQAEAQSAAGFAAAEEGVKDVGADFRRDAGPCIGDR